MSNGTRVNSNSYDAEAGTCPQGITGTTNTSSKWLKGKIKLTHKEQLTGLINGRMQNLLERLSSTCLHKAIQVMMSPCQDYKIKHRTIGRSSDSSNDHDDDNDSIYTDGEMQGWKHKSLKEIINVQSNGILERRSTDGKVTSPMLFKYKLEYQLPHSKWWHARKGKGECSGSKFSTGHDVNAFIDRPNTKEDQAKEDQASSVLHNNDARPFN